MYIFISVDAENTSLAASNDNLYGTDNGLLPLPKTRGRRCQPVSNCAGQTNGQQAVLKVRNASSRTHIFMPYTGDGKKSLFSNQQWALLRTSNSPGFHHPLQ